MSDTDSVENEFALESVEFSFDLYTKIIQGKAGQNLVISPFSIQTGAALAFVGAAGITADEMAEGLRLVSNNHSVVCATFRNFLNAYYETTPLLTIANKIYVQSGYELNSDYKDMSVKSFFSETENIDFENREEACETINKWTEERTEGKITDIVKADALDDDVKLFLVNAIHFKGEWVSKFKPENTGPNEFWISSSEAVEIPMMNIRENFKYAQCEDLEAEILEMPFRDCNISMLFILPSNSDALEELETNLPELDLFKLSAKLETQELLVTIPKFEIEFEQELNDVFKEMGMKQMFEPGADFSNLIDCGKSLHVSKMIHKVFIEINEEGAEAAGVTGFEEVFMSTQCFIANVPFLYLILDDQRNIFFIGRFCKPKVEN